MGERREDPDDRQEVAGEESEGECGTRRWQRGQRLGL